MKTLSHVTRLCVAASLLIVCGFASSNAAAADFVLSSDATATANELREAIRDHTGLRLGPARVVERSVIIPLEQQSEAFRVFAPGLEGTRTAHGALRVPSTYPPSKLPSLVERLSQVRPLLLWNEVGHGARPLTYEIVAETSERLRRGRVRTVALRRGTTGGDPSVGLEADDRFRFSHWLSGQRDVGADGAELERWTPLRDALASFPRSDPGVFGSREKIRGAPKLWAYAAMAASSRGHRAKALAYADVATRFAVADADALHVWQRLTKEQVSVPGDAFSALYAAPDPSDNSVFTYIFILCGFLGWLWVIRRESRQRLVFGCLVSVFAVASFLLASGGGNQSQDKIAVPELPGVLQAPLAGGACVADPMLWSPHGYTVFATCDGDDVSFEVSRRGELGVSVEVLGAKVGPTAQAARDHLNQVFSEALTTGWRLESRPLDGGLNVRRYVALSANDRLERGLAGMLACLAFFMLFVVGRGIWKLVQANLRRDPGLGRWIAALTVLVVVAHIVVESRLVMVYTGYDLASRLGGLDSLPRYGAGAMWIYKPAILLFGISHESIQWLNRILGALLMFPVLGLVLAMRPRARFGALLSAACVGLLPVFLRDHSSEGIQAGTCFLLAMGLSGFMLSVRRGGDVWMAWASLPILLFVATCRPEAVVALPCVVLGALFSRYTVVKRAPTAWFLMGLVAIAWIVPHVWWLLTVTESLVSAQDISPLDGFTAERVARVWMQDNIFYRLAWVPWTLPVLALAALRMKSQRALLLGWLSAALAWIALSSVDLPDVSIPRVHLPAFLLLLPAAGMGFELLRRRRMWQAGVAAVTLVWAVVYAPTVLEATNGDAEEELISRLHQEVEGVGEGACIARLGLDDSPPAGRTPRYFPEYLFPEQSLLPLKDIESNQVSCEKGTWVVLGTRCYMRDPELGSSPNQGPRLDACERVRRDLRLDPVLELKVPHRAESTLPMYPDIDEIELGLYRVLITR